MLPNGITPSNLTYRVFEDTATDSQVLQLRNGNSSVLVYFGPIAQSFDVYNNTDNASPGVNLFQFADGTVLTRAQLLAQATLLPNDFNPQVSVDGQSLTAGEEVSANGFFSATDSSDDPITWYRVTNSGEGGATFTLDGKVQETGQPFYVSAGQLSQLTYVAGAADSTDSIAVSAFDGAIWSTSQTLTISPTGSNTFSATGANQLVTGATSAPDTLVGGYAGDTLMGGSGQDTFLYAAGSGAETISESAPTSSSSNNTLQFGSGITPGMVSLAVTNGALELQIGSNGDSVQIAGFNPTDPLNSIAIQNFNFSDGTSLSLSQLMADASSPSSGTSSNSDGSTTNYAIDPNGAQLYTAETVNGSGRPLSQYTLNSDGSSDADTYAYGSDGSLVLTDVHTPDDTWAGTQMVQTYDAQYQQLSQVVTLLDGTTESNFWQYAADGSVNQTEELITPGDGSPSSETIQTYNSSGQVLTEQQDNADGSTDAKTYTYSSDGSSIVTDIHTPAGGGASETVTQDLNPQGQLVGQQDLNADGSTDAFTYTHGSDGSLVVTDVHTPDNTWAGTELVQTYNAQNQLVSQVVTLLDGTTEANSWQYAAGGWVNQTEVVTTPGDGSQLSETIQTYNSSGQVLTEQQDNADGSADAKSYTYSSDGSSIVTDVHTPAGGGASDTVTQDLNPQGQLVAQQNLNADGSTDAITYSYGSDGSIVVSDAHTPDDTWAGTEMVQTYDAQHQLLSQVVTLLDGTTETNSWQYATGGWVNQTEVVMTPGDGSLSSETIQTYNSGGQVLTKQQDNADGSTDATVWAYNSDGSYSESDVHTPVSGSEEPTTTVQTYNSDNQLTGQNSYAPQSDGSYVDTWSKTDGSQGTYWWNASTLDYHETWQNTDGSTFTDDYQYAAGGSPGSTNVSFTETYSDSSGDGGTRQYNASTGVTTVTWDSAQTGSISGTTANDSGFIGLQLQGELTNTANDPSYFNPATSPAFTSFLAAHG